MPRPLRAGERAPACGDVREMVDAGRCAGRRARRARCCGYMAMWRLCAAAETWIGDGDGSLTRWIQAKNAQGTEPGHIQNPTCGAG